MHAAAATEREPVIEELPGLVTRARGLLAILRQVLVNMFERPDLQKVGAAVDGLTLAVRAGLGTAGDSQLDTYGRDRQLIDRLEPLWDFLYERYWRVHVENAAVIPQGPAILVANHAGALPLDGPVLAQVLFRERPDVREARWLMEDQVFYAPFIGTLFNRLGGVRASPENAERLLAEGRPVLVFPEGMHGLGKPYADRHQLKRFGRGGFVKLALRTGAPIIPVAILGAEETMPLLGKLPGGALGLPYLPLTGPIPLPAKWLVRFGAPISARLAGDELAYVQQVTEAVRGEIESMLQSLLRLRKGAFAA